VVLHDHIIIGRNGRTSLRDLGDLALPSAACSHFDGLSGKTVHLLDERNILANSSNAAGTLNEVEMNEHPDVTPPSNGEHYSEVARKLCGVAHECRFPIARKELLDLAARYERRGDHFDRRSQ
jgi:hypothetical protein